MDMKHAPLPWRAVENIVCASVSGSTDHVATCDGFRTDSERQDTAAFIVRACNSHYELVAALESLLHHIDSINPPSKIFWSGSVEQEEARIILAKAKGE